MNPLRTHRRRLTLAGLSVLAFTTSLGAQESRDDEIRLLREQIRLLDQKLRVLERKSEIKDEEAAAAAKTTPKITVSDKGFTLATPDAASSIRLRGLVQLDSRLFFDDGGIVNNSFVLRRARAIIEGQFAKNFTFQLVPEYGGSSVSILDANLGVTVTPALQVKAGKFKNPIGLEQLQSDSWAFFAERSIASNLVGNRDLGIYATGDVADGRVNYIAGVFNGVADGASTTNADFDQDKELAGRVFALPFKNQGGSLLQGVGVGLSASIGRTKTASALTAGYRTDGQQTFFRYRTTALADGAAWRVSPQAYYYQGAFGLLGEYVISTVNARPTAGAAKAELQNKGWQVAAGYVLTGENAAYAGVVPKSNFNYSEGTWGAFEVVGRVANLQVDDAAFPLFADPAASAKEVTSIGLGLNWYLSKTVKATVDYFQTDFDTGVTPSAALLRQDEQALITRLQVTF